jgi:LmbE family N-acetylglucosaminyl deacetylase
VPAASAVACAVPTETLTLMAVHAHPDDEATGTGGVLARYAAQGVRTVLVTCTDGGCGDGPGGVKPGDPGHDREAVVRQRQAELQRSCELLQVSHLELLGYRDSGMMGWPTNDEPGAFWGMDVETAARPLVGLIERYRPQVLVTYDANGFYGHPDHIMAHRITMAAAAATGVAAKVYHTAAARSSLAALGETLRAKGVDFFRADESDDKGEARPEWGTPDELITTSVDVHAYTKVKLAALAAHGSQADNRFFLDLGDEIYERFFGVESFVRVTDRTGAAVPESDLFAGLPAL